MFYFWFFVCFNITIYRIQSLFNLAGELGEKKDKTMSQNSTDFCFEERKEAKALSSNHGCWKKVKSKSEGFAEQQAAATCNLGLRRAKSMMKQSKKQTFREKRGHETTRTLKHIFLKCSDDFSSSLFQVPHEPGRIMISIFGFFRRFPSHNSIPSHVSSLSASRRSPTKTPRQI